MTDASSGPGIFMLIAILAMAISMAIIPLMIRLAPVTGMIDLPDPRKVHSNPIPRVGGVGLVIGTLIPLLIWLPFDTLTISYLFGALILLIFGVWDDIKDLGAYVKFIGQFSAVIAIVYVGDLYVHHFPFMGFEPIPEFIGKPFTVIAIVGMINAINLSDGLDGLAGGESLLSIGAMAFMAYHYDGIFVMLIAAATIGGIFGFLRFNSHPARIFMGDGGSQFLGFTSGFLVVYLTQHVNTVVSPAVAVLLLGLPIADSLAVFYMRWRNKISMLKAQRDHIHHRLLALGFHHYESVVIIYSVQALFVICAVLIPYESDLTIISIYLLVCALLFTLLTLAERKNWHIRSENVSERRVSRVLLSRNYPLLIQLPKYILEAGVSLFLVGAAFMSTAVPIDFAVSSLILLGLLLLVSVTSWPGISLYRLVLYVTVAFSVYLLSTYPPDWLLEQNGVIYAYFIVMTVSAFAAARMAISEQFQITPLDYLVIIIALVIGIVPDTGFQLTSMVWMVIQIIILFYAIELVIQNMKSHRTRFTGSAAIALALIALRGLV